MLQATQIIVGFFLLSVEDFRKNNTLHAQISEPGARYPEQYASAIE